MKSYYRGPLGWMQVEREVGWLTSLDFISKKPSKGGLLKKSDPIYKQLQRYFAGKNKKFSVPVNVRGTLFQNRVWRELETIPYGTTVSYGEIACRIGKKKSTRAVARAIGQNKIPVFIPCHRVIGSDGSLTGYAYGLRKKAWLLKHESG